MTYNKTPRYEESNLLAITLLSYLKQHKHCLLSADMIMTYKTP